LGQQDPAFFKEAVLDADGTIAPTTANARKGWTFPIKGMGVSSAGRFLSNTGELISLQPQRQLHSSKTRPSIWTGGHGMLSSGV